MCAYIHACLLRGVAIPTDPSKRRGLCVILGAAASAYSRQISLSLSLSSTHTPLTHTHLTAAFEKQIPSSIMSAVATPSPPRPTCDACVFSPFRCIARGREGGEQRERGRGREGGTFRRAYSIVSLQALPPVSGRRGRGRGCSLRRTATAAC